MTKRVTIEADQMYDASVQRISLVKRGANRIPFRVIKSHLESGMIDLSRSFRMSKKTDGPRVVAIALPDDSSLPAVLEALKGSFPTEHVEKNDKGIVIIKSEKDTDLSEKANLVPVKLGETVLLFKGFRPYGMTEATYMETIKAQGFMPGISLAADALFNSISTLLYADDTDKKQLTTKMESLLKDFSSYILGLARDIPDVAFKAESIVAKMKADADARAKEQAESDAEKKQKTASDEQTESEEDEEEDKADATKVDVKEVIKTATEEAIKAATTLISKSLEGMTKSLKDVSGKVDAVKKSSDDMGKKMAAVAQKADAALEAAGATVVGGDPDDDNESTESRRKSEVEDDTGIPAVLDTAFQREVRKSARASAMGLRTHRR